MAVKWTDEQKKVIEYRNRNILVSAAAGSGKTAVLVERIVKKITDKENPVDIDRILVVTFTKAAASEMKERIGVAINKLKEDNPEDLNLDRQMTLLHNAQITTIDSFCLFVVRNHFESINLEPNFRIADTGEIKLLEMDVLAEVFEKNYAKDEPEAFLAFVDAYSGKRNDQAVRDMVSKLYHVSSSSSWPKKWLLSLHNMYDVGDVEELLDTSVLKGILEYSRIMIQEAKERLVALHEMAKDTDGLDKYAQTIEKDLSYFDGVEALQTYEELQEFFAKLSMGNIAAIRNFDGDEARKDAVKNGRAAIKDELKKLKEAYFTVSLEEIIEQLHRIAPFAEELIRLTIEYTEAMQAAKRQKRIVDFSDIEHFALQILVDEETLELRPTAQEFRNQFEEIMIDEYQDSNQVQEDIMCAISRESIGQPNMFMVGDVKQSIYRFRLARPELFMQKYKAYEVEDSLYQRIDLHKNFRSRQEVIDFSNDVFYKIMQEDLGNVAYDEEAALYCGAEYPPCDDMKAELLLFDTKDEMLSEILADEDESSKRMEARMVAKQIQELMQHGQVTDKETGELRAVRYSDIVILFRSLKDWGTEFADVLGACGIPAYVESSTGYFQAYEVQTVLNMLKILDNPYQDIPMTAVLRSPLVGLDDEELADIRIKDKSCAFAELVLRTIEENEEVSEKLQQFGLMYHDLRKRVCDTPIHELIQRLFDVTGFADYVAAMPAGERRIQNLEMLLEKAIAFEKTSYKGLFHFVRYIDQLQKYEVDFGEADATGENEDVVRIMTIHKSKGLEFPIVFVSGMGKKINMRDTSEALVIHSDLGVGLYEMQTNPRVKKQSLIRTEIAEQIRKESLGEELRVLYVALTRAKEKLILTGTIKDRQKTMDKYVGNVLPKVPIAFSQRVKATTYLDWLIPALLSYPTKYEIGFVLADELALDEAKHQAEHVIERNETEALIENAGKDLWKILDQKRKFSYPYAKEFGRKSKYSVSELKHDSMLQAYDQSQSEAGIPEFLKEEKESYIPAFVMKDEHSNSGEKKTGDETAAMTTKVSKGALRGTAVHRVMECFNFVKFLDVDVKDDKSVYAYVKVQLEQMLQKYLITEEMIELINVSQIKSFVTSEVGERMTRAAERGELFREKPFVMEHEGVLVQGIIDVFWLEDGEIVLLDYKTDWVQQRDELIKRYQTQMDLYAKALQKVLSTDEQKYEVKEKILYSFCLQEVIKV